MILALTTWTLLAVLGAEPDAVGIPPKKPTKLNDQAPWLKLYSRAAAEYKIYHDPESDERLELSSQPVYKWTHASQTGGQHGAVYVWTRSGCVEAVACFFLAKESGSRVLSHELHSLSPVALTVVRDGPSQWSPTAGLERQRLNDAPEPAATPAGRLVQMRAIARDFSGSSTTFDDERRELRLLPQPFFRDKSTDEEVIDGALFAFVCPVGTDPELFLLVEARRTDMGANWYYALARFSHFKLTASYKEKQVWQAVRGGSDTFDHSPDHNYRLFFEPVPAQPDGPRATDDDDHKP